MGNAGTSCCSCSFSPFSFPVVGFRWCIFCSHTGLLGVVGQSLRAEIALSVTALWRTSGRFKESGARYRIATGDTALRCLHEEQVCQLRHLLLTVIRMEIRMEIRYYDITPQRNIWFFLFNTFLFAMAAWQKAKPLEGRGRGPHPNISNTPTTCIHRTTISMT